MLLLIAIINIIEFLYSAVSQRLGTGSTALNVT